MTESAVPAQTTRAAIAEPSAGEGERGLVSRILARIGLASDSDIRDVIGDALEEEERSGEIFSEQERTMMHNLLRFGTLTVADVMVPRADIVAVDAQASLSELMSRFQEAGHSRIPVYCDTLDDPRGMVHIKDFMAWIAEQSKKRKRASAARKRASPARKQKPNGNGSASPQPEILRLGGVDLSTTVASAKIDRKMLFVPPSMSVVDLLLRMQATRIHLALVVDEYGGTDGLVSIEDLVEEIVGEIEDEHDQSDAPLINETPERGLVADARVPVAELEGYLGVPLLPADRDEDIDTLGGLVFTLAGHVPVRGELVRHGTDLEFEVLDADARRIKRIRIHRGGRSEDAEPDRPGQPPAARD